MDYDDDEYRENILLRSPINKAESMPKLESVQETLTENYQTATNPNTQKIINNE